MRDLFEELVNGQEGFYIPTPVGNYYPVGNRLQEGCGEKGG